MSKSITRRDFLKAAAAGAAGAAALGIAGPVSASGPYNPGTYTATYYGNISYITVEVSFSQTEITNITVLSQGETAVLFNQVEQQLIPTILENQAGGVDVISGASNSSRAIINAVADCVAQAGGDREAFLAKSVSKVAGADENYEADIAVIGCGGAGFVAAIAAAKAGMKVMVVDRGSGVAAVNGIKVSGPFAVETEVLKNREGGSTLVADDAFYHVMEYTHWTPNPALMRRALDVGKHAVDLLLEVGYNFQEANFRFETPFKGEKGGFHLILNSVEERVSLWEQALAENGVEVLFNTRMDEFIVEEGKVCGFYAKRDDGTLVTVRAQAVIMASGGYLANRDMQERYLGTRHLNVASGGQSLCNGDAIRAAAAVGAGLDKVFGYCPCEYGGTNTKAKRPAKQDKYDQNYAFKFAVYGCLLVDAQGKRFINEGLLCDYPMSYGSEQILRNAPWYAVVDQDYVDAMKTIGLYEYTIPKGANEENWFIGNYFKGRILDRLEEDLEEGIQEGWVYRADSIEELGSFFGLTELAKTVEEYNAFCERGVDTQFGANPWYLSPVKTPPFYVTQNEPSAWSTFGGIRIDDCCRALTCENSVVEGLYVCGTDAGSLYYSPYYDIPGYCYGMCVASGYIAAEEAVAYVKK